ncbi:MAG: isocitrate/isopropylmalate dehydrogenase family protein [Alphaproteobacteria bacterium]|nr:isocitrate/isopropylmalate dehydrogenase family protein [Alphaproteobacteria bacterium]
MRIAVFRGDGIGAEVVDACIAVLEALQRRVGGFRLSFDHLDAGARYYRETGTDIADETVAEAGRAEAILLGAMGDPEIRHADGTEIMPHLMFREVFGLYAGVRPVTAYPNTPRRLRDERAGEIDMVILRESTEGLFHTQGRGQVIDDREARETLLITRETSEKLFDFAFRLAERRKTRGGKALVTCVDKANVFRAFAFFRKIFDERAARFPEIATGYSYVDAQALDFIRRPWDFDVLVTENMFGDILSDLAGGLVGGMGMAACAEIGDRHALFQPAHGSAPDIAGQGTANPMAAILSGGLMLDHLGDRHGIENLSDAARLLDEAVQSGFANGRFLPVEFGGPDGTVAVTRALIEIVTEGIAAPTTVAADG